MSSPSNPNQTPGRSTGSQPNPTGAGPDDPTRTQWSQLVPPASPEPYTPPVAPTDPTRTLWSQPVTPQTGAGPDDPTRTQWSQPVTPPRAEPYAPPAPPTEPPPARKAARRGLRSLFWPGFAAGFLLLSAVSCGVSAAALGLNRLTLDDIRGGTGAVWTPMPVTPTAAVVETAPDAGSGAAPAGSTRFAAGQAARNMTNSRVNIRMTPGYLGKGASDVIGQLDAGQTLTILGEPTLADDLTWWRIQAGDDGQAVVGWVAEATASGVQILGAAQ